MATLCTSSMGCLCAKSATVLDATFPVGYEPREAMRFLLDVANWPMIIPGASLATPERNPFGGREREWQADPVTGKTLDWYLDSRGLTYQFSATKSSNDGGGGDDDAGEVFLSYDVNVVGAGPASLPISFHFSVKYTFAQPDGGGPGSVIRRQVFDLSVNACSCITGCVIKSNLLSACQKENVNMAKLMALKRD